MTNDKKRIIVSTEEGYDRWSEIYDTNNNPLTGLDQMVFFDHFPQDLNDLTIADLGCGTGRVTSMLSEQGAVVTGIDGSEGMLNKARERSIANSTFVHHNFANPLPFETDSFDHVVSCLVLEHIEDLNLFFTEASRICKPGGTVYITGMHPGMMLMGNEANFTDPDTGEEVRPKGYAHQVADFVNSIKSSGLELMKLKEHFGSQELSDKFPKAVKYQDWPMLICFICKS